MSESSHYKLCKKQLIERRQEAAPASESGDGSTIDIRVALAQAILRMKQVEMFKNGERESLPSCIAAIELAECALKNMPLPPLAKRLEEGQ